MVAHKVVTTKQIATKKKYKLNPKYTTRYKVYKLELSFNLTGVLFGSWMFCIQIFPCFGACLGLVCNKEHPILVHRGPNSVRHVLTCQNEFCPQ